MWPKVVWILSPCCCSHFSHFDIANDHFGMENKQQDPLVIGQEKMKMQQFSHKV
jgi:hypothetical protein